MTLEPIGIELLADRIVVSFRQNEKTYAAASALNYEGDPVRQLNLAAQMAKTAIATQLVNLGLIEPLAALGLVQDPGPHIVAAEFKASREAQVKAHEAARARQLQEARDKARTGPDCANCGHPSWKHLGRRCWHGKGSMDSDEQACSCERYERRGPSEGKTP